MTSAGPVQQPRRALPATATSLTGNPHYITSMVLFLLSFGHSTYLCSAVFVDLVRLGGKCLDIARTAVLQSGIGKSGSYMHYCVQRKDCLCWASKRYMAEQASYFLDSCGYQDLAFCHVHVRCCAIYLMPNYASL